MVNDMLHHNNPLLQRNTLILCSETAEMCPVHPSERTFFKKDPRYVSVVSSIVTNLAPWYSMLIVNIVYVVVGTRGV